MIYPKSLQCLNNENEIQQVARLHKKLELIVSSNYTLAAIESTKNPWSIEYTLSPEYSLRPSR